MAKAPKKQAIAALDLKAALAQGTTAQVWYVQGEEQFLTQRCVEEIVSAALGGSSRSMAVEEFRGKNLKLGPLRDALQSVSMFAPQRIVVVHQADAIGDGATQDGLAEIVAAGVTSATLVVQALKLDGRRKLGKALAAHGLAVSCRPLYERHVAAFIKMEAARYKKRIDDGAVTFLMEMGGRRLGDLAGEVGKGAVAAGEEDVIKIEHVAGAADTRLDTVFEFLDAVGLRNGREALLGLDRLLESGVAPAAIAAALGRHIRTLMVARARNDEGMSAEEAARLAGSAVPFRLAPQLRLNSVPRLRSALMALLDVDSAVKGGRLPPRIVLERFVLRMTSSGQTSANPRRVR